MNELLESARATFRKLAVFEVKADDAPLVRSNWNSVKHLLAATDAIDDLFWLQGSAGVDYRSQLSAMGDDEELKEMFLFNRGPYDRFNNNKPFLITEPEPAGKGFYPFDLTQQEFVDYISRHPEDKSAFESPYTVIRRVDSRLASVSYHVEYKDLVLRISELLSQASLSQQHHGFQSFLATRAKDLLVDDFFNSETQWVQLEDNPLDLVIGPYEVYEDSLMGLKAAYEAMLFERDAAETTKVLDLQRGLPSFGRQAEKELGLSVNVQDSNVKLCVGNLLYAGGEARKAVPAIAFSLPNDEQVIEEVGSRQVILKNVIEAKFNLVAWPVATRLLTAPIDEADAFRDFFMHTVFHEIAHSLGPQRINVKGEATTVNRSLRQYHSVLEETKADVLGACLSLMAIDSSEISLFLKTFIACFIRSIRFGLDQAHGGANAIQFNYLLAEKAFAVHVPTGKISVDEAVARAAVNKLTAEVLRIQEQGDFEAARDFINRFCVPSREIEAVAAAVDDLPIDVRIRYLDWK